MNPTTQFIMTWFGDHWFLTFTILVVICSTLYHIFDTVFGCTKCKAEKKAKEDAEGV